MVEDTKNLPSSGEDAADKDDLAEFENELGDEADTAEKPGRKSAEARISELIAEVKTTREELAKLKEERTQTPPPPPAPATSVGVTEQDKKAIDYLKKLGFSRKEELEDKVKAIEDRIALDNEHNRLGTAYDGSDGRPRYEKAKVEEYMRSHAVYDPEVAYKALHETELLDWHTKKAKTGTDTKPYIERPGGSSSNRGDANAITREKLQDVSANPTPVNRAWYEKNRPKILQMMADGQL